MKINKIFNNNVVLVVDAKGKENVIMGKGLAFGKKVGDHIDIDLIDKTFLIRGSKHTSYDELLSSIPIEVYECTEKIVLLIKSRIDIKLSGTFFISLLDHIHSAIIRINDGITINNPIIWEIKRYYKKEYQIGLEAVKIIKEDLGTDLSDDEASFLAIKIVNSFIDESNDKQINVTRISKLMNEILSLVQYFFKKDFDEDSIYYERFITHLKFFSTRIVNGDSSNVIDDGLLEIIKAKYSNSYNCALTIKEFIKKEYSFLVNDNELVYLIIHIEKVIYNN